MIVGVISDTHGLLREEALAQMRGSDYIIHAGDIGSPDILRTLHDVAPLYAIRGNVDSQPWTQKIPSKLELELGGVKFFVIHNRAEITAVAPDVRVVIFGHSHQPLIEYQEKALYFNPGSAGPRRFKLPISVGRLVIRNGKIEPALLALG